MNRLRLVLVTAQVAGTTACATILGIGDPPPVGAEEPDATQPGDGPTGDGGVRRCPPEKGDSAPMVVVGREGGALWCIDAYEVTEIEYGAFVVEKNGDVSGQPADCEWNTSFRPQFFPGTLKTLPVGNVDWCDALAYCTWAGKRLCGSVSDGGVIPISQSSMPDDEWYMACSHNTVYVFPYGNTYKPTYCNGSDYDGGGRLPVGSLPNCEGGFPGIFDMSGNAREWIASCARLADGGTECLNRGGAWYDPGNSNTCDSNGSFQRAPTTYAEQSVGFRCCADFR